LINQSFDAHALRKVLHKRDFSHPDLKNQDVKALLETYSGAISQDGFKIGAARTVTIRGKQVKVLDNVCDCLALRKVNDTIRRIYHIKQADRNKIVKQLSSLLSEQTPYAIVRADIKSFYESINAKNIIDKLHGDAYISQESMVILENYISDSTQYVGVPRGTCISATLTEMALQKFDISISRLEGVYYYARYVDDIIILTYRNPCDAIRKIKENLPEGLEINNKKTRIIHVPCKKYSSSSLDRLNCKETVACDKQSIAFDFLGYNFKFQCFIKAKKEEFKEVKIGIANKKIGKIKKRLISAFFDYNKTEDFDMLHDRVKFLTGNFRVPTSRVNRAIMSGIYYNYRMLSQPSESLRELDHFLRLLINQRSSTFRLKLYSLPSLDVKTLNHCSFRAGFKNRIRHRFSVQNLSQIKKCWLYA